MNILLSWIYLAFKPTPDHKVDIVLVRQLKSACKRLEEDGLIKEFFIPKKKSKDEITFEIEKKQRIKDLTNMNGIFYCSKCKYRTNEKTPTTKCVICDTSLERG